MFVEALKNERERIGWVLQVLVSNQLIVNVLVVPIVVEEGLKALKIALSPVECLPD